MTLGDARWEAAGGRIGAAARFRYLLAALAARLRASIRAQGGAVPSIDRLDLDRIVYPDSACAKSALEKVHALSSPAFANHALRTYIWGSLLGQLDGQRWDAEILFVAALLHDLGLTEALHGTCAGAQCFTLDGVHGAAQVFALTTPERGERMRRAVLLHLNIEVSGQRHGWEAHYVRAGALLDVFGQRYGELPLGAVGVTLDRHPRLNLEQEIGTWVRREAQLRPSSRLAILARLGFVELARRAPFATGRNGHE